MHGMQLLGLQKKPLWEDQSSNPADMPIWYGTRHFIDYIWKTYKQISKRKIPTTVLYRTASTRGYRGYTYPKKQPFQFSPKHPCPHQSHTTVQYSYKYEYEYEYPAVSWNFPFLVSLYRTFPISQCNKQYSTRTSTRIVYYLPVMSSTVLVSSITCSYSTSTSNNTF